jgi:hypothetical protein
MKLLIAFNAMYIVALFLYGVGVDSPLTYVYVGLTLLILAVFGVIHRWARFPMGLLWAISLVGLGNMVGGVTLVGGEPLYSDGSVGPVKFDKLFHWLAALVFYFVAWHLVQVWAGSGYHRGGMLMLTFLLVLGGGAVVEIAELIGTAISDVSVGDYRNNALDLVANAVGAAIGWAWVGWHRGFPAENESG